MKKRLDKLRKWLIITLGGHIEPPSPRIRWEEVAEPVVTVSAEAVYATGCSHKSIEKLVARQLADEICRLGIVKYDYCDHPQYDPGSAGQVRGTIRVVGHWRD